MKATRRGVLAGALAVPLTAAVPRGDAIGAPLLVFDPTLAAGRRLVEVYSGLVMPIKGDRIRFARAIFARQPATVIGVSRPTDAMLIEDVGREAGYLPVDKEATILREIIASAQPVDRDLVLGWVLAPKS